MQQRHAVRPPPHLHPQAGVEALEEASLCCGRSMTAQDEEAEPAAVSTRSLSAGALEGQVKAGSKQPAQAGGIRGGVWRSPPGGGGGGMGQGRPQTDAGERRPRGCARTLSLKRLSQPVLPHGHRKPQSSTHLTAACPASRPGQDKRRCPKRTAEEPPPSPTPGWPHPAAPRPAPSSNQAAPLPPQGL